MIFSLSSFYEFYQTFLIIGSHIVFISILGLLNRSLQSNIQTAHLILLFPKRKEE